MSLPEKEEITVTTELLINVVRGPRPFSSQRKRQHILGGESEEIPKKQPNKKTRGGYFCNTSPTKKK